MLTATRPVGDLVREWRQRRRLSQMDLAGDAEISTRHLSFIETGRSTPSRDMVLRLAERLDVPLRVRTETGVLSFLSTTTIFGTPVDITLSEHALETFFPADAETAAALGTRSLSYGEPRL